MWGTGVLLLNDLRLVYICKLITTRLFHELLNWVKFQGLPWWLIWKSVCLQCRRSGFDPWVRTIPWRRKWQPTSVFLPGKSHGPEEPGRLQSMGSQRAGHNWVTSLFFPRRNCLKFFYMYSCCCLVAKSCLTLGNPMNCSPPGFSVDGISQARILEWIAISFSGDLPNPVIKFAFPVLACVFFTAELPRKPVQK